MSTTKNGIYYPNDYDLVADIPADMKKMAESVDTKIAENETEIEKIKKEQTTQSTNISNLQKDNTTKKTDISNKKNKDTEQDKYIAELEAENLRLREDLNGLPKGQASGESIDLSDSAEMRCELKISGNSIQNGEPTPDTPVEVESCGDNINLFDKDNVTIGQRLTNNANSTYNSPANSTSTYIRIKPNTTYYISNYNCFHIYDKDYNILSQQFLTEQNSRAVLTPDNSYYIRISTSTSEIDICQIKQGSIPTPYSPYGQGCINEVIDNGLETTDTNYKSQTYTIPTQQPFRAIGDYRDTFIKKDGKRYERHYISRKIFDGTENWEIYGSDANTYRRFGLSITGNMPKLITTTSYGIFGKGLCSHFGTQMNYTTTDLILFVHIANPIWYIGITDFNSKWANVTALKEWLSSQYNAGTPVYVDYILKTPLDIECTEEQNKILDKIEKEVKTYKNITHMYSTDKISSYKDVTYKKDIETLLNNTQALAVNNASEGV